MPHTENLQLQYAAFLRPWLPKTVILEDLERLSSRLSQLTQLMQTLVADNHALQRELNLQRQETLRLQTVMQTTLTALDATLEQMPLPAVLAAAVSEPPSAEPAPPVPDAVNAASAPAAATTRTNNTARLPRTAASAAAAGNRSSALV